MRVCCSRSSATYPLFTGVSFFQIDCATKSARQSEAPGGLEGLRRPEKQSGGLFSLSNGSVDPGNAAPPCVIRSSDMCGARRRRPPCPVGNEGGRSRNEAQSTKCDNAELRQFLRSRACPARAKMLSLHLFRPGGGGRRAQWAMKAGEAAMRHRALSATMPN